ncbi:MAG: carbohydrate kinase [Candidatus Heimdallarchaeota archaeon]|nr:carbohydrate kinase [Candidatus Heimdallarchaeota archaeon]MBY8993679.1 carbohydrate kinase [Candidatus Heimdallarchaeota archaeon]
MISIGEVLVDFLSEDVGTLNTVKRFQKCPGGAPANFAVGLARLGVDVAFIGKVGDDPFGKFLTNVLKNEKVNIDNVIKAQKDERTALAFVSLDEDAERDFVFYRKNAADLQLTEKEIKSDYLTNAKYIHFGTVSLTEEPSRTATITAIDKCRGAGGKSCFDPNLRLDLWENLKTLREIIDKILRKTDILYPSLEELKFILQREDIEEQEAIDLIMKKYPIEIVALKMGKEGCLIKKREDFFLAVPSFEVQVLDTTGAGDGFNVGFIFGLLEEKSIQEAGVIGNAVGALVVQKKGAMTSLPTREELQEFLKNQNVEIGI